MKVVITGGNGFVGSHVIEHLFKNTDWEIVVFDKMSEVSISTSRLLDIDDWADFKDRIRFYAIDLNLPIPKKIDEEIGEIDYILHIASESHVDRSISDPVPFVLNNVSAALHILEYARKHKELKMFVNFSTDEVYGPAPVGKDFKEFEYHYPTNPYAASKSAQEKIGISYSNTYGVPLINTHTMNIFGERQHPEKFIPLVIKKVLAGEEVTIHANKEKTQAGSRFYLHARNLADALLHILNLGYKGYDEWNIAGLKEIDNLSLAQMISEYVGKPLRYKMVDFHSSRPGHDLRYAIDSSKLIASGYKFPKDLEESLKKTVEWYLERPDWL